MTVTRMCCVCRARKPRAQLLRVVRTPQGSFALDTTGHADGRGCYVCNDAACIRKGVKMRFANRAFRCEVPTELYDEVMQYGAE